MGTNVKRFTCIAAAALLAAALCMLALAATPHQAQAVDKIGKGVVLVGPEYGGKTDNDTYKKADVTGDGVKDVIEVTNKIDDPKDSRYLIYPVTKTLKVNGKTIKTWEYVASNDSFGYVVTVHVVTFANGKSYLLIGDGASKNGTEALYRVKGDKLECAFNLTKALKGKNSASIAYGSDLRYVAKVKKNTFYLGATFNTKALGGLTTAKPGLRIKSSGSKLKVKKTVAVKYTLDGDESSFVAAKAIKATKKAGGKKKALTIAKGTKFSVSKVTIKSKKLYAKVKTAQGKSGWVKLGSKKIVKEKASA